MPRTTHKPTPPLPTCPRCDSKRTTKKGMRTTRHEKRQRYGCRACGHTFINQVTKHSRYPVKLIMEGITFYNRGYSARQTQRYLKRRFAITVPEKTLRFWYAAHRPLCTYAQLRGEIKRQYTPAELTPQYHLEHRQVYCYQIHTGKLDVLLSTPTHHTYQPLKTYLAAVASDAFPHALFTETHGDRSSNYPALLTARVTRKANNATKLAALALQIAPSNIKRHETIQRFMLVNDSATIAVEVPIYLTTDDFAVFRAHGFTFPFGEYPITGHIDFLQLRSGFLHILDYKPAARKEKHVVTQLTIYALALSQRTGLPVKSFKCAWFDEHDYFEFYPLPVVYT